MVRDDRGYRVQDTEWHRITAAGNLGKTIEEHCEKGMKVLVRGRIHYTKWTDQQGNDRYGCEIIAETVDFLNRAKQTETTTASSSTTMTSRSDRTAGDPAAKAAGISHVRAASTPPPKLRPLSATPLYAKGSNRPACARRTFGGGHHADHRQPRTIATVGAASQGQRRQGQCRANRLRQAGETTLLWLNLGSGPGLPGSTGPLRKRAVASSSPARLTSPKHFESPSSREWSPPKSRSRTMTLATYQCLRRQSRLHPDGRHRHLPRRRRLMSVMPATEYDGDDDTIVSEIDPFA